MEEKERYVYHEVSNEVEQYECYYDTEKCCELFDNEDILNRLNKQDKRIKELEEELDYAKRDYIPKLEFGLQRANKMGRDAEKENQQLKQQLHDLPKKIVEDIKKVSDTTTLWWSAEVYDYTIIAKDLDAILKKYGGEDE